MTIAIAIALPILITMSSHHFPHSQVLVTTCQKYQTIIMQLCLRGDIVERCYVGHQFISGVTCSRCQMATLHCPAEAAVFAFAFGFVCASRASNKFLHASRSRPLPFLFDDTVGVTNCDYVDQCWSILSFRPSRGLSPLPRCTQVSNPRVVVVSSTSRQSSDFLASSTTSSVTQAGANFSLSFLPPIPYTSILCCSQVTSCHPRGILITVSSTRTSLSRVWLWPWLCLNMFYMSLICSMYSYIF